MSDQEPTRPAAQPAVEEEQLPPDQEWITVKSPTSDATAQVTRMNFEDTWEAKGYTEVTEEQQQRSSRKRGS